MFKIVLFEPEIPPNTGNIIRLCSNMGAELHLIKPLGFDLDDKKLRRAGLDYNEWVNVKQHENYEEFLSEVKPDRIFACSTHGTKRYCDVEFKAGDAFLMGPETRGLPKSLMASLPVENVITLPMLPNNRSLNLSNATAIILYEAWRQNEFFGAS